MDVPLVPAIAAASLVVNAFLDPETKDVIQLIPKLIETLSQFGSADVEKVFKKGVEVLKCVECAVLAGGQVIQVLNSHVFDSERFKEKVKDLREKYKHLEAKIRKLEELVREIGQNWSVKWMKPEYKESWLLAIGSFDVEVLLIETDVEAYATRIEMAINDVTRYIEGKDNELWKDKVGIFGGAVIGLACVVTCAICPATGIIVVSPAVGGCGLQLLATIKAFCDMKNQQNARKSKAELVDLKLYLEEAKKTLYRHKETVNHFR